MTLRQKVCREVYTRVMESIIGNSAKHASSGKNEQNLGRLIYCAGERQSKKRKRLKINMCKIPNHKNINDCSKVLIIKGTRLIAI